MNYPILSTVETQAQLLKRKRQKIDWPADKLAIGESFLIPLVNGVDPQGRHEDTVRALVVKFGKKLCRRFSCRKTEDGGLAVIRIS